MKIQLMAYTDTIKKENVQISITPHPQTKIIKIIIITDNKLYFITQLGFGLEIK